MVWLGKNNHYGKHSNGEVSVGELFGALAVVASVVESVSGSGVRSSNECEAAENAVSTLLDFFGF